MCPLWGHMEMRKALVTNISSSTLQEVRKSCEFASCEITERKCFQHFPFLVQAKCVPEMVLTGRGLAYRLRVQVW